MIHGSIYEARPEINAVIHNHAYEVIPLGHRRAAARSCTLAASLSDIPTGISVTGSTNHLVVTMDQGRLVVSASGGLRS
jgi:hypothetical protein